VPWELELSLLFLRSLFFALPLEVFENVTGFHFQIDHQEIFPDDTVGNFFIGEIFELASTYSI
jgi:hypothetical protein